MPSDDGSSADAVTLGRLCLYFLRLGATGFGGPIALVGFMQRDLVDARRWISRQDFLDGLALAQLAPGPLAVQLAIYLGFVRHGVIGATLVGLAFVLPSFLMVWAISAAYVHFGGLPWIQALFYAIGAAVIGIIAKSAYHLTRLSVHGALSWGIFLALAISTAWTEEEIVWLFLAGGAAAVVARRLAPEHIAVPALAPLALAAAQPAAAAGSASLLSILWFFGKAGAFVFGSGLAIVPFLYGGVRQLGWLNDRQFLDAVAVAMITPGPVVITVAFIGYLVAGAAGMTVAAVGVFLPVYLFVLIPAPYFRRHGAQPLVKAFVEGVTAAATGAIAGAAVVLARRAFVDATTACIGVATLVVLLRWRISELWMIGAAALLGLALGR